MRSIRHWTPRYVYDRLKLFVHERRCPADPWLTSDAVQFLEQWLRPSDVGIEWGSGRSTVWLGRRVGRLTSIEHDPRWFQQVGTALVGMNLPVDLRLAPLGDPGSWNSEHPYVRVAQEVPAASLDFALVDGALRDYCAEAVLDRIKPGGLVVVDNANWFFPHATRSPSSVGPAGQCPSPAWTRVWQRLSTHRRVWTTSGVTDTALFFIG